VSVNVSGIQLVSGDLSTHVMRALSDSGLPAEHLVLEITESTLLENSDVVLDDLSRIKALGVKLAMDDFGAGYSSLASLLRFRFDLLKIDRSSLDVETAGDRSLVQAIAELGGALRLKVVAEGVETAQQLARVRAAGCDAAQGFFLARPMTLGDTRAFLHARSNGSSAERRVPVLTVPAG
jgi:EAL domain-containing protein (putative c-di-GMP-specific phosphodiesterase class I)